MKRQRQDDQAHRRPVGFNATPMIDVIFMLTIFFMLVSRFSSEESVPMDLPNPTASQAKDVKLSDRQVINCIFAGSIDEPARRVRYRLGPNQPESLEMIGRHLAALKQKTPDLKVIIRADKRLPYADVRAAMEVVAANNIQMISVVAHVGEGA